MNVSKKPSFSNKTIPYFLFAGRRIDYLGTKHLKLIKPYSGRHFYVEEKKMNNAYIYLGSFLRATRTTRRVLTDFEPMEKPKKFQVRVEGDVAYLENLPCSLVSEGDVKVFKSKTLGDVLCREQLELGEYLVRAHLMKKTTVTEDGRIFHFEGKHMPTIEMLDFQALKVSEDPQDSSAGTEEIETQPAIKLVLNAPFDVKNTYQIRITNLSENRIGFGVKAKNKKRFSVDPKFGVLDSKKSTLVSIVTKVFEHDPNADDKIKIGWINAPGKVFQQEWFKDKTQIRHRSLKIEYNV